MEADNSKSYGQEIAVSTDFRKLLHDRSHHGSSSWIEQNRMDWSDDGSLHSETQPGVPVYRPTPAPHFTQKNSHRKSRILNEPTTAHRACRVVCLRKPHGKLLSEGSGGRADVALLWLMSQ